MRLPHSLGRYAEIVRHSGVYALTEILSRLVGFLLISVYTRILTREDYGVLEIFDTMLNLIGVFLGLRIPQALFYYHGQARDEEERDLAFTAALVASGTISALALAFALVDPSWINRELFRGTAEPFYIRLALINVALTFPLELGLATFRLFNESTHFMLWMVLRSLLAAALNIWLVVGLRLGYRSILWSTFAVSVLASAGVLWRYRQRFRWRFSWRALRAQLAYAVPMGVSGIALFVINWADRMWLVRYVPMGEVGIYALAYKLGFVVAFIHSAFDNFWSAQMYRYLAEEGGDKMYARVYTYLLGVLSLLCALMFGWIGPVLGVLAGPAFQTAAGYIPYVGLAYTIRALASGYRGIFYVEKRADLEGFTTLGAAGVCLIGYAWWIPWYGVAGAVAATVVGFLAMTVASGWYSTRLRPIPFEYGRWAKLTLALAAAAVVPWLLGKGSLAWGLTVGMLSTTAYFAVLGVSGFLRAGEWAILRRLVVRG